MTKIIYFPVAVRSKYVALISSALPENYQTEFLSTPDLDPVIRRIRGGESIILHIQWEEFAFKTCRSAKNALSIARLLERQLKKLRRISARVVWTVHNGIPHQIKFVESFLHLRRAVARAADVILVHNRSSIQFLKDQIGLGPERMRILRHPSYLGHYEPEQVTLLAPVRQTGRTILGFGTLRDQKGFDEMLEMLSPDFLAQQGARVRIVGEGKAGEGLRQRHAARGDVDFALGYVPDSDVPGLLRSVACIVLPYRHFLTSGVAHLALTHGVPMVAPDAEQFRELIPAHNHGLLFREGDADDFRRAVATALNLTEAERLRLARAFLEQAQELHPHKISGQLAAVYDELARQRRKVVGLLEHLLGRLRISPTGI